MPADNIIIPGASPVKAVPTTDVPKFGGVSFAQGESSLIKPVHLKPGQHPNDILMGNPASKPYAVNIPWLLNMVDVELKHTLFFLRGKSGMDVVGTAPQLWQQYVRPIMGLPESAEFLGEPQAVAIDDGDWYECYREAVRYYKQDEKEYPLQMYGDALYPYAFCSPYLWFDFKYLRRDNVDNRMTR